MGESLRPEQIAGIAGKAMYAADHAAKAAGIVIDAIAPGRCVASMTIVHAMLNGIGVCHGGFIFMLADTALGFACNSHGPYAVAQHCAINYLRPGALGDRLSAVAELRAKHGRTGIYDIKVMRRLADADGAVRDEVVAEFRGQTRDVEGSWV